MFRRVSIAFFLLMFAAGIGAVVYRVTRPSQYERFLRIQKGDSIQQVIRWLGQPEFVNERTNETDYLFSVSGHPDYPRLFGVPVPASRIVRVRDGKVAAKGPYEDYYDPYKPVWTPKGSPEEAGEGIQTEKAAQPGATDNPDDAQRLREDH